MWKALARRATFLPIFPRPTMPSTLSSSSKTRFAEKSLPRQRPATTFSCCQTSRRDTASINSSACSATATEFEPPLLQIGTPAARATKIEPVIAGAEQLDQFQPGRGPVEFGAERKARAADIIFGVLQRCGEFGAVKLGDDQLVSGRQYIARDIHHRVRELRSH